MLYDIIALNQTVVELMMDYRFQEAAPLLIQGIASMNIYRKENSDLFANTTKRATDETLSSSLFCHPTMTTGPSNHMLRHVMLEPPCQENDVSPGNPLPFYSILFFINPTMSLQCSPETFDDLLSAVMMFNLAIHHHRAAMMGFGSGSRQMNTALKLYRMVHCVVRPWVEYGPATFLWTMATANMAHIHAHFLDKSRTSECVANIDRVLQYTDNDELEHVLQDFSFYEICCQGAFQRAPAA